MHACHRAVDAAMPAESREMFAVKAVNLGCVTPGDRKKNRSEKAQADALPGAESGMADERKPAGLPRREERVAAEFKALRRLEEGTGSGGGESGGRSVGGEVHDVQILRACGRALFPAIHDFFILRSNIPDDRRGASNVDTDADAVASTSPSRHSSVVCYTVMTRCPGGKDLMALLAAAPGHRLPESQARFYAAEVALALDAVHRIARMVETLACSTAL